MRRILTLAATAAVATLLVAGPAAAQDELYPPPGEECAQLEATTVAVGGSVSVSSAGDCWQPGATISFSLFSEHTDLGSATAADDGSFSTEVTIPSHIAPGTHTFRTEGAGSDGEPQVIDQQVTVVAPDAPADDEGTLPRTGLELTAGLVATALLLGVGGSALYVARKRSRMVND